MRKCIPVIMAVLILSSTAAVASDTGSKLYSVAFPGWGQMKSGRFGRGALFMGLEILNLTALAMTEIQYNRAVDQYESARASFLAADYIGDIERYYSRMNMKWDEADKYHKYRNTLLGTAVGIWAISIVDMMFGGEADPPPLSLEVGSGSFLVTGTVSF